MPTYEYACTACGHRLEAVQSFTDDPLTECPECGGALRKVYGAVGIVLKGSGFYKTDSRASSGSGSGKKSADSNGGSADSSSSESSSSSKKDTADKGGSGAPVGSDKSSASKDTASASSTAG